MKILKKLRRPRTVLLAFIILLTTAVLAGLMQQSLKLTVYEITSPDVPEGFDGYRIAHISDFHSGRFAGFAGDVVRLAAGQNPDIICLTGDIVDGRTQDFAPVEALISGLSAIAPVYAVSGNNERYEAAVSVKMDEIYAKYGVQCIDGRKITIYGGAMPRQSDATPDATGPPVPSGALTLFGIADPRGDDMKISREILSDKDNYNGEGFGIILYHRANEFDALTGMGYQLVLSGHLHGGLVRLPFTGGLLSPYNEWFPRYSGGLYESSGVWLVSNGGIGNNHPIPRMYNPPEVVVVVLSRG